MRTAIVESGGKQYRAVEGSTIDVDRLVHEVGKKFDFERVLLMVDEDTVMVGTPTVGEIKVSATVVEHLKGPKLVSFKYRPKKRIRVKSGHRQHYTRLMIDFIGKAGEERKAAAKKETPAAVKEEARVEKQATAPKEATAPSKKAEKKTPATKKPAATKLTAKKPTSKSSATKKTDKK